MVKRLCESVLKNASLKILTTLAAIQKKESETTNTLIFEFLNTLPEAIKGIICKELYHDAAMPKNAKDLAEKIKSYNNRGLDEQGILSVSGKRKETRKEYEREATVTKREIYNEWEKPPKPPYIPIGPENSKPIDLILLEENREFSENLLKQKPPKSLLKKVTTHTPVAEEVSKPAGP